MNGQAMSPTQRSLLLKVATGLNAARATIASLLPSLLFLAPAQTTVAAPAVQSPGDRPNILWLVSEDNGTFLGCYGDPLANTPTLDRLASRGVLFERCFAQPVCAP